MDNQVYVTLSRQQILMRQMDVVANNIANADTPGFKVEQLITQTNAQSLPNAAPGTGPLQFALDTGVARDFSQGALSQSGRPLDVAIQGDGFFQVNTARGDRYTRDGRFTVDGTGRLVTASGDAVAGDGGGEITLDPTKGEPTIAPDGTISQGGASVGKLATYKFASNAALSKDGDGLFRNTGNQSPTATTVATTRLQQGTIEASNVQPVVEITRMVEVSREYERVANMMDQSSQLNTEAIQRLGKVS